MEDPRHTSQLGNTTLYEDSSVLRTITGRFFPDNNSSRRFLDISRLKHNELAVFSEFLPSQNEELGSVSYMLEDPCIDLWSYSVESCQFDLILVLDCTQSLHLFSLKSQSTPHSQLDCPFAMRKIPSSIGRPPYSFGNCPDFNESICAAHSQKTRMSEPDIYKSQFSVKSEASISPFKKKRIPRVDFFRPYKHSKRYFDSNPLIFEKLVPKYHIATDHKTGYIIVYTPKSSVLIVPSHITLTKDGAIEEIRLNVQTEHLFHLDSLRYRLESISFLETCQKDREATQPVIFCLLTDLKTHTLGSKTFLFDWNNILKNQTNPRDNYRKPISETNFTPFINSDSVTSSTSELYHTRMFCTNTPVVHMNDTKHVSVGKLAIGKISIPAFACALTCTCRKLLIIFSYEKNELKLVFGRDFCEKKEKEERESVLTIDLKNYYEERIYVDLRDLVVIEESFEESRMKFLISSKCMEMFVLSIRLVDCGIGGFDLIKLRPDSPAFGLSDISSVCPYTYCSQDSLAVESVLVSSTFGVSKQIYLADFRRERFVLAPRVAQILSVEKSVMAPDFFENRLVLAAKRYQFCWDKVKRGYNFQYDFILRYIFLSSPRISTLVIFPLRKSGVIGASIMPLEEGHGHLVVYSKLCETRADLLVRLDGASDLGIVEVDGLLLGDMTTLLCVRVCQDLALQVTETRVLLYQGISEQVDMVLAGPGRKDSPLQARRRDLWNRSDLIMYARMADDRNLLILTQAHKLVHLTIQSFESFDSFVVDELAHVSVISSFGSRRLMVDQVPPVILSLVGDCQGRVSAVLWPVQSPLERFRSLLEMDGLAGSDREKNYLEAGMVTWIEFDHTYQDSVYFATSRGYLFILDVKGVVRDLLQGRVRMVQSDYSRLVLDLKSYHSSGEILDWKVLEVQRRYFFDGHCQVWKSRIILGSVSLHLCVELLETSEKILKILQVRRLKFPMCSIILPLREGHRKDSLRFFCLEGGKAQQQARIVQMELNECQICDKVLPLEGTVHHEVEDFIYLRERRWLVVNLRGRDASLRSCEGEETARVAVSQLFLLDSEARLHGSRTYDCRHPDGPSGFQRSLGVRIFPNNGKDSFFQVFSREEDRTRVRSTVIQLVSVPDGSCEGTCLPEDHFRISGSCSFQGVESAFLYKPPASQRRYLLFLVGWGLDLYGTADLVSTRVLNCLDVSRPGQSADSVCLTDLPPDRIISFGTELALKVEDSIVFPGKRVCRVAPQGSAGRAIRLELAEPRSSLAAEFVLHRMCSDLGKELRLTQAEYEGSALSCPSQETLDEQLQVYRESSSGRVSLVRSARPLSKEGKMFAVGMQILLNYMFKRANHETVSVLPCLFTNLLFAIFDAVFSSRVKVSSSKSVPPGPGREGAPFFPKKKANPLDRKQVEDGLSKVRLRSLEISDLYSQTCSKCGVRWRISMVLVVWYNLLTKLIDGHTHIRSLSCPLAQDWNLELEKDTPIIDSHLLTDQSFLLENFLKPSYFPKYYQELTLSGLDN